MGKPFGYYYVFGDDLVDGMPTDAGGWWFVWYVPSGIWAWLHTSNRVWHAEFTNDVLSPWREVAFCIPPQEYRLPLAEGWSGWAKYSKDQFGRVLVYGLVAKSTALISGDVIGTFPEGFRPSATCPMTITSGNASDGKSFATSGYVQPSGVFTLTNGIISSGYNVGNNIAFNFVFPAAS